MAKKKTTKKAEAPHPDTLRLDYLEGLLAKRQTMCRVAFTASGGLNLFETHLMPAFPSVREAIDDVRGASGDQES